MEKMISLFSDLRRIDDLINDLDEGIKGVYLIAIEETKTLIIGQSTNIVGRFKSHLYAMRLYGLKRQNVTTSNLEVKVSQEPWKPSWENPWQDIEMIGEQNFIERIKSKREIADKFASLGTVNVKIESAKKGEIDLYITCYKSKDVIERAFLLLKDLQWFLEMSQY